VSTAHSVVRYVRRNADELAILAVLTKLAFDGSEVSFSDDEEAVLAAMRRSTDALRDASPAEIGEYLRGLDDDALPGVVSNVKGILHEMEFVAIENGDGDPIYASIFPETNHPGTDVQFVDRGSGEVWEVQLKATDEASYVQDWVDAHPGGEIVVTSEVAREMGLPSSGFDNQELTTRVEDFVDRLIELGDDETVWSYLPALSLVSISVALWELYRRYQRGEINFDRFKALAAAMTGLKLAKIAAICALLSIPVVNVLTGAALVASLLLSTRGAVGHAEFLRARPLLTSGP
jgi:hypothetical protein